MSAWAADGEQREVTVNVPQLGEVSLLARPCGSVYLAKLQPNKMQFEPPIVTLKLLDPDGMHPSASFAADKTP